MTRDEYYTAPPQSIFDEIKENAIKIWQTYDDTYSYATEKVNRVKGIENVKDNAWYIVAMFDISNQIKLLSMLSPEAGKMILSAMQGTI